MSGNLWDRLALLGWALVALGLWFGNGGLRRPRGLELVHDYARNGHKTDDELEHELEHEEGAPA